MPRPARCALLAADARAGRYEQTADGPEHPQTRRSRPRIQESTQSPRARSSRTCGHPHWRCIGTRAYARDEFGLAATRVGQELEHAAQQRQPHAPANQGPTQMHMLERARDSGDPFLIPGSVSWIVSDAPEVARGMQLRWHDL